MLKTITETSPGALVFCLVLAMLPEPANVIRDQAGQSAEIAEPASQPDQNLRYGEPGSGKAISSEADLAAAIAQLQQPDSRLQAFLALLDFAGWPKGNALSDDAQLNRMHHEAQKAMNECPALDGVIATMIRDLDEPNHRLRMISSLLKFGPNFHMAGSVVFVSDNPKLDALKDKAAQAVEQAADVKTVTEALADPDVRVWAVSKFGNPLGRTEQWTALLPKEEEAASDKDESLRSAAVGPLACFPGAEKFLDQRFAAEKSPLILMALLHERNVYNEEFNRKFLPRFVQLLSNPDESVRDDALWYVWATFSWAECYRLPFGRDVFDLVIKATQSKSAKERGAAVAALECIRQLDPDASREAFLRLVNDPDENIRSTMGESLADQYGREDVKRAIGALVNDKSFVVRQATIIAVGPKYSGA